MESDSAILFADDGLARFFPLPATQSESVEESFHSTSSSEDVATGDDVIEPEESMCHDCLSDDESTSETS